MLTLNEISFSRRGTKILGGLSFNLAQGECAVLAGPNGCGKSTALSLIAGIIKPDSGVLRKCGKIGYIPQDTALIEDATVLENLRFFANLSKSPLPEKYPFSVGSMLRKRTSRLSGGMKKQLSIACALMGNPQIMMLDEPCASLDITFRDEMADMVKAFKSEGRAVVYVGHEPSEFYSFFDYLIFVGRESVCYSREDLKEYLSDMEQFEKLYKNTMKKLYKEIKNHEKLDNIF